MRPDVEVFMRRDGKLVRLFVDEVAYSHSYINDRPQMGLIVRLPVPQRLAWRPWLIPGLSALVFIALVTLSKLVWLLLCPTCGR